jgi:hypothetical protein
MQLDELPQGGPQGILETALSTESEAIQVWWPEISTVVEFSNLIPGVYPQVISTHTQSLNRS